MTDENKGLSVSADRKIRAYGMPVLVATVLVPPAVALEGAAQGFLAFGLIFLSAWIFGASTLRKVALVKWVCVSALLAVCAFFVARFANGYIEMIRLVVIVFSVFFVLKLLLNVRTLIPPQQE